MFDNLYLQMQSRNISIVDKILEPMEGDFLSLVIQQDAVPLPQATVLSALSQMWVFAFFELIRTWSSLSSHFLNLSQKIKRGNLQSQSQLVENEAAKIKKAARLILDQDGARYRLKALHWVTDDPAGAEKALNNALHQTRDLKRMLADVRNILAKHQITGSNTYAPSPGYGTISPLNGSISWRIIYEQEGGETLISRRDLADQCRATLGSPTPLI
jgi:hypothetical protein